MRSKHHGPTATALSHNLALLVARDGRTAHEISRAAGVDPGTIGRAISGRHTNLSQRVLAAIAAELRTTPQDLLAPDGGAGAGQAAAGVAPDIAPGTRDLPIYACGGGGPGFEVLEYQPRPQQLAGVVGAFGVRLTSDRCAPRFYAGEVVLVHPWRQPVPSPRSFVVLTMTDGRREVYRLTGLDETSLRVERADGSGAATVPRDEVAAIGLIVGARFD